MAALSPVNSGPNRVARFALAKFRPTTLPGTLVGRPALHEQLMAGAGKRLTVVVGSAGTGKSVLLSSWAAARQQGVTSWLSCDEADASPVRFWTGFIEAPRRVVPWFGADAGELLGMDGVMSADVTASILNDAARLPAGTAIVVDDFHAAAAAVARDMTALIARWPSSTAQLVLASRADPPVRLHRLRMAGELCELRDRDLSLSLAEAGALLANFGVQVTADEVALLLKGSEGWVAALQMAALTLRGAKDPVQAARALDVRGHAIAEYFIAEVLQQQPAEVARFMLDTSVLDELTAGACAAVTGSRDAAVLLRGINAANLFLVALDDEQTSYRYHHLVRQVLRAELHATDRTRELALQVRAAEWFASAGDTQRAARHFLAAQKADRALALLHDRVMADFLHDPALPAPLDLSMVDPVLLARAPDRLLALAADLLLQGDWARGGQCLDLLDRIQPPIPADSRLGARLAVMRAARYGLIGDADQAVREALAARRSAAGARLDDDDEWIAALLTILLRAYTYLEDFEAVDREAAAALATPSLPEPFKLVLVRGAQAFAWFTAGRLADAAEAAWAAEADARRLGFEQHPWAVDHLRALAGAALEQRDLDAAESLTERALSISERGRAVFEFHVLLDRAEIWAARGQVRQALATIESARAVLPARRSLLRTRADELEALLRLSLGDLRSAAELAGRLPAARRGLLLARAALAVGDHQAALAHLKELPGDLPPRGALVRQLLLAAAAIERGDPAAGGILGGILGTARREGYLHTVVTTAPQVTRYLVENAPHAGPEPALVQLIGAALQVRTTQPATARSGAGPIEALTAAELRVLKLLPTTSYLQMAATLYVSRNTVKTHLRAIYLKLGVSSRSQAIERAVELRLL